MNLEQERLERVFAETVAHEKKRLRRNLTELEKDRIGWDLRIQSQYAGQYVVYVDRVLQKNGHQRLGREVLFTSPSWQDVAEFTAALSEEELRQTLVEYEPAICT